VHNRADSVGRAVVSVLAQTFGDLELVVVDHGSTDGTVEAVRLVADGRVRVVTNRSDSCSSMTLPIAMGLERARGDRAAVIDADTTARPHWLARCGLLIDRTGADLVFCGGSQHHRDGSLSEIRPVPRCSRPGAFIARRETLIERLSTRAPTLEEPADLARWIAVHDELGPEHDMTTAHTPEALLDWFDISRRRLPEGELRRLQWVRDALDLLGDSPIPDVDLLARYATIGGVTAARLRRHADAREMFALARRMRPGELKPLARWLVARVPPLSEMVWESSPPGEPDVAERTGAAGTEAGADPWALGPAPIPDGATLVDDLPR